MNRLTRLASLALAVAFTAPALAQHDHDDDHPDIEVELDGLDIGYHPEEYNLKVSHDNYAFTKPSSVWRSTFPGFEGENLGNTRTFDLVSVGPLYEYDDSQPDGSKFVAAVNEFVRIIDAGVAGQIDVTGTSSTQTLADGVGTTNSSGVLHQHPVFQLQTDSLGDPADGAYLLEFQIASSGLNTSPSFWVLFHKGLDDLAYDTAIHEAEEQFGLTVIPEPASVALLGAGALMMGLRRRGRAAA